MKENRLVTVVCATVTTLVGLELLFILLKILHLVSWSWLWVASPFWIPLLIITVSVMIVLTTAGFVDEDNEIEL